VQSTESPKSLDPNQTYPCPACRHGVLVSITLTDAWGCDRCKQIFETRDEPGTLSKLTTPYHRQHVWRWTGKEWVLGSYPLRAKAPNTYIFAFFLGCLLWLGLSRIVAPSFLLFAILALAVLLIVMFWVLRRR
jgi:hypothetical protein